MPSRSPLAVSVLKLILEENGKLQELSFDEERITIGRTADNAVRISDALSSRHHCQISRAGDGFQVEDLKSRNGTKLNGQPLTEPTVLQPGDRIEVGDSYVHFAERQEAGARGASAKRKPVTRRQSSSGPASSGPASGPGHQGPGDPIKTSDAACLRVGAGPEAGKTVKLTSLPFVVGRKKGASLALQDEDVSNEHCMIVEDQGLLHLVDLGSTNGTFLDGERLRGRAPLRRGSTIRLGKTLTLELVVAGEGPREGKKASVRKSAASAGSARAARAGSARAAAEAEVSAPEVEDDPAEAPGDVDEVQDLDALGGDEDEAPAGPQPARARASAPQPSGSRAPARRAPSARPAAPAPDPDDSAMEAEAVGADLGTRLEAAAAGEGRSGGAALGVVVVLAAALLTLGAGGLAVRSLLSRPENDPAPELNLLDNWSFEESGPGGALPGWELSADQALRVGGARVAYGRQALELKVAPDSRPEVRSAPVTVSVGRQYNARAAMALGAGTGGALLVEWRSKNDPSFLRHSVAVALPIAAGDRAWREVSGKVVAPRGATEARVVAVALADGAGDVRFDRLVLAPTAGEDEEGASLERLPGPAGVELLLDARGVVILERSGLEIVTDLGLALDPRDPLAHQGAIRLDQPLGPQADGSLLALGSLPYPGPQTKPDLAFSAGSTSEGVRLRWSLGGGAGSLWLTFRIPHLEDAAPLLLDGAAFPAALEAKGQAWDQVSELAFWKGEKQVSLRFSSPARLEARPAGSGAEIAVAIPPSALATGEVGVGLELGAASQSARAEQQRLLREAEAARRAGELGQAIALLGELTSRFPHEKELVARAQRDAAELRARAERLAQVVEWAHAEGREAAVEGLIAAARSALSDLERIFPRSRELERARGRLSELEAARRELERRELSARARDLLQRGLQHREARRVRLARRIWTHVVEQFPPDLKEVEEARGRLAALPSPEEGTR